MITFIHEHYNKGNDAVDITIEGLTFDRDYHYQFVRKRRKEKIDCFRIRSDKHAEKHLISNNFFVGLDWIVKGQYALYVAPKIDSPDKETHYLKMLFSALKHPEVGLHTDDLFEIKFEDPLIEIEHRFDLLTPLLMVNFLSVVKTIVRKGLKRAYYKMEETLNGKIKGKVVVGKTIRQNITHSSALGVVCAFDEFGLNGPENRLLKKALRFVTYYSSSVRLQGGDDTFISAALSYIMPAFERVSDEIGIDDLKHVKVNPFFKEYNEAIKLAQIILRRFGYNVSKAHKEDKAKVPPFWIDMSKLFELYVLGLLKDRFGEAVRYHFTDAYNELDFLLNDRSYKMVIDAKYKPKYSKGHENVDVRQVSGYARLKSVYTTLNKPLNEMIDCLIVYPDQEHGLENFDNIDLKAFAIDPYLQMYKVGVKLPVM